MHTTVTSCFNSHYRQFACTTTALVLRFCGAMLKGEWGVTTKGAYFKGGFTWFRQRTGKQNQSDEDISSCAEGVTHTV